MGQALKEADLLQKAERKQEEEIKQEEEEKSTTTTSTKVEPKQEEDAPKIVLLSNIDVNGNKISETKE